jgi:uncharacterized membrane protein YesL
MPRGVHTKLVRATCPGTQRALRIPSSPRASPLHGSRRAGSPSIDAPRAIKYTPAMGHLLARIYRKFFWRTYDNIGRMVAINAIWFALFIVPTLVCYRYAPLRGGWIALTVLVGLITQSFAGSGVFALTARLARREEIRVRHFFGEARRFFPRMLALSLIFGAIFFLLYVSIRFYAGGSGAPGKTSASASEGLASAVSATAAPASEGLASAVSATAAPSSEGLASAATGTAASNSIFRRPHLGALGFFLAGIQIWILAFAVLMQVYLLPLLFVRDWGIGRTIKWSAMLVVLRPGLSVLLFLQAFAILALLAITGVGIAVLLYSATSLFLNVALLETLKEMDEKWTPKQKPTSWKEIMAEQEKDGDERRILGDILRPWD